jgi:hypothetical protein
MGLGKYFRFGIFVNIFNIDRLLKLGVKALIAILAFPFLLYFALHGYWTDYKATLAYSLNKEWKTVDVVPDAIAFGVTTTPENKIVVVGGIKNESDVCWLMKERGSDSKDWKILDRFCEKGHVLIALKSYVNKNKIFVIGNALSTYTEGCPKGCQRLEWLVRMSLDGGNTWATSDRFVGRALDSDSKYECQTMSKSITGIEDKIFVAGSVCGRSHLKMLDTAEAIPTWRTIESIPNINIHSLSANANGHLILTGGAAGLYEALYYSKDNGRSWEDIGKLEFVKKKEICTSFPGFKPAINSNMFSAEWVIAGTTACDGERRFLGGYPFAMIINATGGDVQKIGDEKYDSTRKDSQIAGGIEIVPGQYLLAGTEGPVPTLQRHFEELGMPRWTIWRLEKDNFQVADKFAIARKDRSIARDLAIFNENSIVAVGESSDVLFESYEYIFLYPRGGESEGPGYGHTIRTEFAKHNWVVRIGPK